MREIFVDYEYGDDLNPGTFAAPYKHDRGMSGWYGGGVAYNPGDIIRFKRGVVWPKATGTSFEGTSSDPITYTDYGDAEEPATLQPSDYLTGWSLHAAGIYVADLASLVASFIVLDNEIPLPSVSSIAEITENSFFYDSGAQKLYVGVDGDIADHTISAPHTVHCFAVSKAYIHVYGLRVRHGYDTQTGGIKLYAGVTEKVGCIVEECESVACGTGIYNYNTDATIRKNTARNCWNGQQYPAGAGFGLITGRGGVFADNIIEGCYTGVGTTTGNIGGIFTNNKILDSIVNSVGYLYGTAAGPCKVFGNYIRHSPAAAVGHGLCATATAGNYVTAKNNIVEIPTGTINHVNINCIYLRDGSDYTGIDFDSNDYFVADGLSCKIGRLWESEAVPVVDYDTLNAFRDVTGTDAKSISADPQLDTAGRPATNSPIVGAGQVIPGIHDQSTPATDIDGKPILFIPNMGPYDDRVSKTITEANYAPTGYSVRAGATLTLKGGGDVDLSGITDTGEIICKLVGDINSFVPNGDDTKLSSMKKKKIYNLNERSL